MKAYQAELLACGAANSAALATVFGRAEDHGADRLRSVVWPWLEPLAGAAEDEYEHLGSVWRHMARDWTAGGAAQTGHLRAEARLAWTIASGLPGARVTGSEASEAQLRGLEASEAQLSAANFFLQSDAVVTSFFLDCVPGVADSLRSIHALLRPGGPTSGPLSARRAVGLCRPSNPPPLQPMPSSHHIDCVCPPGPLAYHCWPQLCPTLDQLVGLASEVGLTPLGEPRLLPAGYVQRPGGFGAHEHAWTAAVLVCRRGE
ncbi:hypothetical protein EMIHUDRAFT_117151 [Emiliania huxleyi CCMP1516]|uniref:Uncharacterized protein n=2 Tax=Emiliania huxleyi TaxID=2903 RepID=A0A0D3JD81_EMIH1|nr:hypothetical protein EMIHUDRAFT_117151 [Emiliania huxleyi CCMP1516]EOD21466.1 hypothetical protein EMIHUDRAFT_117151 [Emiliania huxleyi CCMP1516]|eukprot:XP_005773895.1 hypothetical protein EMIHUDRAFT_117151 [Emiliania huxleyi CCMP1516]